MPLYVHSCLSQVSGIAMMVNCLISVLVGLYGSGKHGSHTVDEELAICPFVYKYFRIVMLTGSILFNLGRFIYECVRSDVMLITVFFRCFASIIQLMEHLYLCQHFEYYFTKLEGESFFWTRVMFSLAGFCGLGIFSGLEGVNGNGKAEDEQIYWSLLLCLLIWGGLIWGRCQPGGLGRVKYLACRGAFSLCFLLTLILVIADPTASGVVNRIVIGALFIIATIIVHFLHRRDIRDVALIDGAEVKERSRRSPNAAMSMLGRINSAVSMLGRSNSMVAVESPSEDNENPMPGRNNSKLSAKAPIMEPLPKDIESSHLSADISLKDNPSTLCQTLPIQSELVQTGSAVLLDTESQIAHSVENKTTTVSTDRHLSRMMSYEFVSDARRGRLINDMYMSKAVAIVGQVVGWYCFIFVVELCVFAYFVTNFGSPPKVCPSFSSILLPMCQIVVDSIF